MDLLNIDVDLAVCALLDIRLEFVDLGALTADDDTGSRRVDRNAKLVCHPLHFDVADAGMGELFFEVALEFQVLVQ